MTLGSEDSETGAETHPARTTSGKVILANVAIVLGLVGFLPTWYAPLAALPAIVVGAAALLLRGRGTGRAIAGVIAGVAGIVLMFIWSPLQETLEVARHQRCQSNLRAINSAIWAYRGANRYGPPPSLRVLADEKHLDAKLLRCPKSGKEYFYFPQPDRAPAWVGTACDLRDNHGGEGRAVLTLIGGTSFMKEADFQVYLAKPENATFAEALRVAEQGRQAAATQGAVAVTAEDRDRAVTVAKTYLKEHRPEWYKDLDRAYGIEVRDKGSVWEVRELLPPDVLGGGAVVQIDKATMQVTRACHEQ